MRCPACKGKRFKKDVLGVKYRVADISTVLEMTIDEALSLFDGVPDIADKLSLLAEVGLGYLQLGQSVATLSGDRASC